MKKAILVYYYSEVAPEADALLLEVDDVVHQALVNMLVDGNQHITESRWNLMINTPFDNLTNVQLGHQVELVADFWYEYGR